MRALATSRYHVPIRAARGASLRGGLPRSGHHAARDPGGALPSSAARCCQAASARPDAAAQLPVPLPRRAHRGAFVGMATGWRRCAVARWGARWRLPGWAGSPLGRRARPPVDRPHVDRTRRADRARAALTSAAVIGTMPNVPANRINRALDLGGPGLTVASEELSGLRALELACDALREGTVDAAIAGAVDFAGEPVHEAASAALGMPALGGDAAVAWILGAVSRTRATRQRSRVGGAPGPGPRRGQGERSARRRRSGHPPASGAAGRRRPCSSARNVDSSCCGTQAWAARQAPWCSTRRAPRATCPRLRRPAATSWRSRRTWPRCASRPSERSTRYTCRATAAIAGDFHLAGGPARWRARWTTAARRGGSGARARAAAVTAVPQPAPMNRRCRAPRPAPAPVAPVVERARSDHFTARSDARARLAPPGAGAAGAPRAPRRAAPAHGRARPHHRDGHGPAGGRPVRRSAAPPADVAAAQAAPAMRRHRDYRPGLPTQSPWLPSAAPTRGPTARLALIPLPPRRSTRATSRRRRPPLVSDRARRAALPRRPRGRIASGRISSTPQARVFAQQDGYRRSRCCMPMPPPPGRPRDRHPRRARLDAAASTIWTETDVREDSPGTSTAVSCRPGDPHRSGTRADLFLISYLGDRRSSNQGERAYRLLGCEAAPTTAICRGRAAAAPPSSDPRRRPRAPRRRRASSSSTTAAGIGDRKVLPVRGGAGRLLHRRGGGSTRSGGVLWCPDDHAHLIPATRVSTRPRSPCPRSASSPRPRCDAFAERRLARLLRRARLRGSRLHARADPSRSRAGQACGCSSRVLTELDPRGGPWSAAATCAVALADPPGRLVLRRPLQERSVHAGHAHVRGLPASHGVLPRRLPTRLLARQGRGAFSRVPEREAYKDACCRGQVVPTSKEARLRGLRRGCPRRPDPDAVRGPSLGTVDGHKAFHARRNVGLQLVPDWPLSDRPNAAAARSPEPELRRREGRLPLRSLRLAAGVRVGAAIGCVRHDV